MTWLYVPPTGSTSCPSAPEAADSISASNWQFQALEASAWSKGKPSASRNWYQLWKRAIWLQRLFGAMPERSMAAHGVAQWTASLAASRASLTASPASGLSEKIPAISGQQPAALSSSRARGSSSSKTSEACSPAAALSGYGETFADLASRVSSDYFLRQKSGRRTNANASSSSLWLTPDMPGGGRSLPEGTSATGIKPDGTKAQIGLENQSRMWLTPSANEDAAGTVDGKMQRMITHQAKEVSSSLWSTPRASDGEKGGPNMSFGAGGVPLPTQSAHWPTPTSLSFGDSHQPGNSRSYNETMRLASSLPGPSDADGWFRTLGQRPELEPAFRRVADGLASALDIARVDRLRMLGNGVVPLEAGYAVRTLATRLAARGSAGAAFLAGVTP